MVEKLKNEVGSLKKEIEEKDKEIENLKNRLAFLENQVLSKNKKIFGPSSEKIDSNQLNFFNEVEKDSNVKLDEPTVEEITYKRNKPSKNKQDNFSNLEIIEIEHKLEEDQLKCSICNTTMEVIGKKTKDTLVYEPAKMYIERHISYSYACKNCEKVTGEANIITTESSKNLITKSLASNKLLAHIISQKYEYAMPLYRQESYFKNLGVCLSRQTMSNWAISCSEKLEIVYKEFKSRLLASNYIQADETTLKVIDPKGNESKSKIYMWLYKTCNSENPVVLYEYQKTRSSSWPKKFLDGFSGYLQTDGYSGYNKLEKIKHIYCMAHIRRYFYKVIEPIQKNEEALKKSRALIGFNYCEEIYSLEKNIREKYCNDKDFYQIRYKIREKELKPLLDKFNNYIKQEKENALPESPLGKAIAYSEKVLPNMNLVLEDGHLEIDNNAAERAIKPFVIGRKNWLFSNTPRGAKASATLYSIIETAKANNLIAERYLVYLFDKLTGIDDLKQLDLEEMMPWATNIPSDIKINKNK
ncbi:IS66 family transposase [Intestinibacter bartlettii]|uniref:IS66 family transposase n=1 Tax=Intestinibacter bartlettii TaxID=261299 RepID=UPI0026DC7EFF|nr:IS66 family transposase [Intestinibacter bartlettii]